MADRGILFSAPMVRALLAGRKTQTRRLLKPQPETFLVKGEECEVGCMIVDGETFPRIFTGLVLTSQRLSCAPGDRLWVREAWRAHRVVDDIKPSLLTPGRNVWHEADRDNCDAHGRLRPGMFMPRWASRITLTVTDVRVQRLQAISEADAIAEGIIEYEPTLEDPAEYSFVDGGMIFYSAVEAYEALWSTLHTKPGERWDDNPWIVAVSFDVRGGNIDAEVRRG